MTGRKPFVLCVFLVCLLLAAAPSLATEWLAGDHLAEARELLRVRDLTGAARALRAVLADDPADARARYALVECLIESNRIDDALAEAWRGTEAAPESGYSWAALGDAQVAVADFDEARASYERGVRQGTPRARLGLARLLESEREMPAARAQVERAYQDDPMDPRIGFALARITANRATADELFAKTLAEDFYLEPYERKSVEGALESRKRLGGGGRCEPAESAKVQQIKLRKIRPAAGEEDRLAMKVSLNGKKPFLSLLDTGASGLLLTEREAESAGAVRLGNVSFLGIGNDGPQDAYLARVERLDIGGLTFKDCLVRVSNSEYLDGRLNGYSSLMGFDWFYRDFQVTVDFPAATMSLDPLPPLPRAADGERDHYGYARDVRKLDAGYLPIRIFGSDLLLPTLVNSKRRAYFLIDTGAATNFVSERFGGVTRDLRPSGFRVEGLSGEVRDVKAVSNLELLVGGIRQQHDSILALDLDGMAVVTGFGLDGIIGYDLLRHAVMTVDFRNALVKIERAPR